jgi:hypothetical protein
VHEAPLPPDGVNGVEIHPPAQGIAPELRMNAKHLQIGDPPQVLMRFEADVIPQVPFPVVHIREIDVAKGNQSLPDENTDNKPLGTDMGFHEIAGKRFEQIFSAQASKDDILKRHDLRQIALFQVAHFKGGFFGLRRRLAPFQFSVRNHTDSFPSTIGEGCLIKIGASPFERKNREQGHESMVFPYFSEKAKRLFSPE